MMGGFSTKLFIHLFFPVLGTVKIARALPLAETNHELAQFLFSRRDQTQQEDTGTQGGVERKRKVARLQAVQQKLGDTSNQIVSVRVVLSVCMQICLPAHTHTHILTVEILLCIVHLILILSLYRL